MSSSSTTAAMAAAAGSNSISGGPASSGKAISRLLQHSILQLCNEHIAYSHKLQILGVLCMTVDDEQHELVVKVNNTLKRVAPLNKDALSAAVASPGGGYQQQQQQQQQQQTQAGQGQQNQSVNGVSAPVSESHPGPQPVVALYNSTVVPPPPLPSSPFSVPNPLVASGAGYSTEAVNEGEGSTTPLSPSASPSASPVENGRKSHGRKRSKPMRVDHVYDEGGTIEEADGDILTVIPTDPDNPHDNGPIVQPVYLDHLSDEDDERMDEDDEEEVEDSLPPPRPSPRRAPPSSRKPAKSTASASVRALLQQSIARKGQQQQHSQLRSALLNNAEPNAAAAQSLTLPICVAPDERRPPLTNGDSAAAAAATDDDNESTGGGQLHIDEESGGQSKYDGNGVLDDSGVGGVKEEPRDEYDWSRAGQVDDAIAAAASYTSTPFYAIASPGGMDGITSLPTYSGLSLALTTANLQMPIASSIHDGGGGCSGSGGGGLSIRYTATGPITVGANGKSVSRQRPASTGRSSTPGAQKVKDIIMYDDQSPLSQQKGARLETDFMVDKMGLEGRKRRRRAPDETLTTEEIAEYMGASSVLDTSIGHGNFQCKYCPVELDELVLYLQHTLAVHNAYICHQCGKSFTTKSSLLRHRPIHTGMRRFACSICKKTFYRKDKCKAHIKRHLGGEEGTPIVE